MKSFLLLCFFFGAHSSWAEDEKSPEAGGAEAAEFGDEDAAPVDVSEFAQPEPERVFPERGQIVIPVESMEHEEMSHWQEWLGELDAKRWGQYRVQVVYRLKRAAMGLQIKFGEFAVKDQIFRSEADGEPARAVIGTLYLEKPARVPVKILSPPEDGAAGFEPVELRLIPGPEGNPAVQEEDGSVILLAKNATTWSDKMRYEPKETKNCLGFWTEVEDFAEWEFQVENPGKFAVDVYQGCGGPGGSEVGILLGDQEIAFTVVGTGGYQNWQKVEAGALRIEEKGTQRLTIQPKSKRDRR